MELVRRQQGKEVPSEMHLDIVALEAGGGGGRQVSRNQRESAIWADTWGQRFQVECQGPVQASAGWAGGTDGFQGEGETGRR